jgi:hypothetical protein
MAMKVQGGKMVPHAYNAQASAKTLAFLNELGMVVTRKMPSDAELSGALRPESKAELLKAIDILRRITYGAK